jgi:Ala-tRNA(Pro) deacylase
MPNHPASSASQPRRSCCVHGFDLGDGGKALVLKVGEAFHLFVLNEMMRLDSSAIKDYFGSRRIRFAKVEELNTFTGLVPGTVPPFGDPILPFNLFADTSLTKNPAIVFTAGSLSEFFILAMEDYLAIAKPTIFPFAIIA